MVLAQQQGANNHYTCSAGSVIFLVGDEMATADTKYYLQTISLTIFETYPWKIKPINTWWFQWMVAWSFTYVIHCECHHQHYLLNPETPLLLFHDPLEMYLWLFFSKSFEVNLQDCLHTVLLAHDWALFDMLSVFRCWIWHI